MIWFVTSNYSIADLDLKKFLSTRTDPQRPVEQFSIVPESRRSSMLATMRRVTPRGGVSGSLDPVGLRG
jgi:hypothetical protein